MANILLRAGVTFSPRDIDTRAIRTALNKELTSRVRLTKLSIGRQARNTLQSDFQLIPLSVQNSRFGRSARAQLQNTFGTIPFTIQQVAFSPRAIRNLQNQVQELQTTVTTRAAGGGAGGGAAAGAAGAQATLTAQTNAANQALTRQATVAQSVSTQVNAYKNQVNQAATAGANFGVSSLKSVGIAEKFGETIGKITTRFVAYLGALRAIFLVQEAFAASLRVIFQFDSALQDLQKVLQTTPEGLAQVSRGLFDVAANTGRAVTDVAESFGVFRRAIDDTEEALRRTEAALIAANISELTVSESTALVTSSLQIFGGELNSAIEGLDILSAISDQAATTATQLGRGVLRAGAAADAVGVSFTQLNAIIAATQEATQLGGAQIGSALKTIFARIAGSSAQLRQQANAFGANITAADGVFETLEKLAAIFPRLNKEQAASITQIVAGKRRFTEFNAILSSFNRTVDLLAAGQGAAGTALAKNQAELDKLSTAVQGVRNEFAQFITTLTGTDQGAEGVVTIRNAIAGIIELISSAGATLNGLLDSFGELEGLGSAILGAFVGIVNVGLFKVGPALIGRILAGLRNFVTTGQQAAQVINAQAQALTQVQQGTNQVVSNEKKVLVELEKERQLRLAILRLQQNAANIRAPGGAAAGNLGFFQRQTAAAGRAISVAGNNFGRALRATGRTLRSGLQRVSESSLGVAIAASAAAAAVTNWGSELQKSEDSTTRFAGQLAQATGEATNLGVQVGLLAGPIAGLGVATLAAVFKIRQATEEAAALQIIAAERLEESITGVVTEGEAWAIAGEEGVRVFRDLAVVSAQNGRAIADETRFRQELNNLIVSGNSQLAASLRLVDQALIDFDKQIKANARGIQLRSEFDKITRQLSAEAIKLRLELESGNFGSEFRDVIGTTAELESLFDRFVARGGEIEGSLTKQTRLLEASKAAREGEFGEALKILQTNLLTTAELDRQNKELAVAQQRLKEIEETEGAQTLDRQRTLLENIQKRVEAEKANLAALEEAKKAGDDIATIDQDIARSKESIANDSRTAAALERSIGEFTEKLSQANSKVLELKKQQTQVSEDEIKFVAEIEKLLVKQAAQAQNVALRIQLGTNNLREQNDAAEEGLAIRAAQIQAELRGGTLAQRQEAQVAAVRIRSQEQIKAKQDEIRAGVEELNQQAQVAARQGLKEQADALERAANEAERAGEAQIQELQRKATIEVNLRLIETNKRNIEQAEEALQNFRLNNIQRLVQEEQNAAQRRIDLVRSLQDTAGGREFLRNEFRPQPGLERQLGQFGAIIAQELDRQADAAIAGIIAEFQELQVGATSSVEELNSTFRAVRDQEEELARLRRSGASAEEITEAEKRLESLKQKFEEISNSGADAFEKLSFLQQAEAQIIQREEQKNAEIREEALDRAKKAAEDVKSAEDALIEARNKIPALNAKIIESQRALGQANARVQEAQAALVQANQRLADEQFKLNFQVELAGFKARQSAGAFGSAQEAINAVAGAFTRATSSVKASSQAILEARRAALQEELNIVQSQLSAVEGLALQAATATDDQLATLQNQLATAQDIAAGRIGADEIGGLDPEILSGIGQFAEVVPGLKEALRNIGAERLGLDPGIFQTFENQLVELQTGIAETGRGQLESAQQQVATAQAQLEEARQQKEIAQQNLDNAIQAKEAALANVAAQAGQVTVQRASLGEIRRQTNRTLSEFRPGRIANEEAAAALAFIRGEIVKQTEAAQAFKESNLKQLDALTQELEQAKATKAAAEKTANASESTAEQAQRTADATTAAGPDIALTQTNTAETATNTAQTNTLVERGNSLLERIADGIGNLGGSFLSGIGGLLGIGNAATGTLSSGEIAGLLAAAQREKRAMPSGANLMLANTSETVLTNRQFTRFKQAAKGHIPNAQNGFGDTSGIESMIGRVAEALAGLQNSTNQVAAAVTAQGPIQVNVDSQRSVTVNGLQELPAAVQRVVEDRIGGVPSQEEVQAVRDSVTEVLTRLRENGMEDFG